VTIYKPFFGYYFLNGLMFVLQLLHIFWAILIVRMAVRFLTTNVCWTVESNNTLTQTYTDKLFEMF
jgi:ceramide synthetase